MHIMPWKFECIVRIIILSLVRCFVFTLRQPGCQMIVGIISFPDLRKMRQGQKMKRQKYGFHFFGTSNFWDQFQLKVVACFYVINCGQTMSEWDKGKGGQGKYKAGLERDSNSSFENFFVIISKSPPKKQDICKEDLKEEILPWFV